MLIVQKYGGSSVADKERIFNAASKIAASYDSGNNVVVIVSAQGNTTDMLIETANNEVEEVKDNDNLLYDMTKDNSKPMVDQVTLADAEEYFQDLGLEYNIDYKDTRYEKATGRRVKNATESVKKEEDSDDANLEDNLFDLIDSMYKDGEE